MMMVPVAAAILFAGCTKETSDVRLDPKLGTAKISSITSNSALVEGFVVAQGDGFTEKGICYDIAAEPNSGQVKDPLYRITDISLLRSGSGRTELCHAVFCTGICCRTDRYIIR